MLLRGVIFFLAVAACGGHALAQVRPTPTPVPTPTPAPTPRPLARGIAPPTTVYPILKMPPANPPFSFFWTPVNGALMYELQVSDRFDVRSRVLIDVTIPGTAFFFTNTNLPGSGFTALQPRGVPLAGGPYYWRVRAISGASSTIFSPVATFTLGTTPGGMPIHDLSIARVSVSENPTMNMPAAILVRVENRGSFAATGASVLVSIDGQMLGEQEVGALGPGENDTIAVPWSPSHSGHSSIVATLDSADDIPVLKSLSADVWVSAQKPVVASYLGVIGGSCGSYVLNDEQGNTIARLQSSGAATATLVALYNQRASVRGEFSIGAQGPQITVQSVTLAGAANASPRNPCAP